MAELENIIESFMSSPENMSKIMDVVKMLGGESGENKEEPKAQEGEMQSLLSLPQAGSPPSGLDPKMMSMIVELLKDYNASDDRRVKLLNALRPYLKGEDSAHIDKAIHIVKLAHVAKSAFLNFLK